MEYRLVGGPMDGQTIKTTGQVIELASHPGMAYHKTNAPEWQEPDPDWWMKGLPEPEPPEKVFEWHERDWDPPVVAAIRAAVIEAAERAFGPAERMTKRHTNRA